MAIEQRDFKAVLIDCGLNAAGAVQQAYIQMQINPAGVQNVTPELLDRHKSIVEKIQALRGEIYDFAHQVLGV